MKSFSALFPLFEINRNIYIYTNLCNYILAPVIAHLSFSRHYIDLKLCEKDQTCVIYVNNEFLYL